MLHSELQDSKVQTYYTMGLNELATPLYPSISPIITIIKKEPFFHPLLSYFSQHSHLMHRIGSKWDISNKKQNFSPCRAPSRRGVPQPRLRSTRGARTRGRGGGAGTRTRGSRGRGCART